MNRNGSYRRFQERKQKKHVQNILKNISHDKELANDEKQIGIFAHSSKGCSCMMCGNPRKHFKEISIAEKKANLDFNEEVNGELPELV